ncbi:MAG: GNAT family N-acetyltransferase [Blastocatellia bacterium]|nr:GNAT family N-acetyltransferase [Blastocatellia bacterium]
MIVKPVTLVGDFVRLEPMALTHLDGLCEVGLEASLWALTPTQVETRTDMFGYVEAALGDAARGAALPFVTIEKASGKVVGSTRFFEIGTANLRCEIGWTWIAPAWQRTAINTESKLLMLTHAFETWGCNRVQLKTDVLNMQSRTAILRLGAKEEGIFRQHIVCADGRLRDSIYFSIIKDEWPSVKARLEERLSVK